MENRFRVGVISDTHGLGRREALAALRGVDHIIHAGYVGSPAVLEELGKIAPITAVRGKVDQEVWARLLPETAVVEPGKVVLYVIHGVHDLKLDPHVAGLAAVISGHSHRPLQEWRGGALYFNPGGAGPRRFRLPVALGFLTIDGGALSGEIVELQL